MQNQLNSAIEILEGDLTVLSKILFYTTIDGERKSVLVDVEIENNDNNITLAFDMKSLDEIFWKNSVAFFKKFIKSDYRIKMEKDDYTETKLYR